MANTRAPAACNQHGCPNPATTRGRCLNHQPHGRASRSPTTRAQNAEYHTERNRILTPGPDGQPPACTLRIRCTGAPATTADHVIPVADGGRHTGNLRPACQSCNSARGATTP